MSLSITAADNQNNTGLTVVVAGSDSDSDNAVYTAPLQRGNNTPAWSLAASRAGDGSIAVAAPAGYYYLYASGTVNDSPALSPPIIAVASIASLAVQTQVEQAIQAKIQTLSLNSLSPPLPDIPASRVYRFDTLMSDELLPLMTTPCVIVTPAPAPERVQGIVNSRDDIGWPVTVLVLANFATRQQGFADNIKKWREQIFRALRYQPLPSVPEVYTVLPEPHPILLRKPPEYQYVYSAITFRAVGRDYRGV